jgi:hypothetical protein
MKYLPCIQNKKLQDVSKMLGQTSGLPDKK